MAMVHAELSGKIREIQRGVLPCTVSITHATKSGGIKSNILLDTLAMIPTENDARYGRSAQKKAGNSCVLIESVQELQSVPCIEYLGHQVVRCQHGLGPWLMGNTQHDFWGMR